MPLNESDELAAIRQTAQMVTTWRAEAAERGWLSIILRIDDLRTIETQMWTAYAYACEADAKKDEPSAAGGE
jgi:hypothetical protein